MLKVYILMSLKQLERVCVGVLIFNNTGNLSH